MGPVDLEHNLSQALARSIKRKQRSSYYALPLRNVKFMFEIDWRYCMCRLSLAAGFG